MLKLCWTKRFEWSSFQTTSAILNSTSGILPCWQCVVTLLVNWKNVYDAKTIKRRECGSHTILIACCLFFSNWERLKSHINYNLCIFLSQNLFNGFGFMFIQLFVSKTLKPNLSLTLWNVCYASQVCESSSRRYLILSWWPFQTFLSAF